MSELGKELESDPGGGIVVDASYVVDNDTSARPPNLSLVSCDLDL